MPQPTMIDSVDAAVENLGKALRNIADARKAELDAAQYVPIGDFDADERHRRHMLAHRALATAEKLVREAVEVLSC